MSSASPETPDRQPQSVSRTQEVTVRRAPNLLAFVATGAAVGALVGLLVGALGPGSIAYTRAAIIGFFLMMFLILGATLGAVVGLLLAALYQPVWTGAVRGVADIALVLLALAALMLWRLPPWLVVIASGIAGALPGLLH